MHLYLKKLIINTMPLCGYLEQLNVLVVTKCIGQSPAPPLVNNMYYLYLATVYVVTAIKALIFKCVTGYARGFWINLITMIQLILQVIIIFAIQLGIGLDDDYEFVLLGLAIFLTIFGFTTLIRFLFVLLIFSQVLKKYQATKNIEIKQTYWLMLTTNQQLYERKGRLIYDPTEGITKQNSDSLISTNQNSNERL